MSFAIKPVDRVGVHTRMPGMSPDAEEQQRSDDERTVREEDDASGHFNCMVALAEGPARGIQVLPEAAQAAMVWHHAWHWLQRIWYLQVLNAIGFSDL